MRRRTYVDTLQNNYEEVRQRYPHLHWQEMIGMRNIASHEYFGVDPEVIRRTVHEDLPQLRVRAARSSAS